MPFLVLGLLWGNRGGLYSHLLWLQWGPEDDVQPVVSTVTGLVYGLLILVFSTFCLSLPGQLQRSASLAMPARRRRKSAIVACSFRSPAEISVGQPSSFPA